jgi:hypothetical protein
VIAIGSILRRAFPTGERVLVIALALLATSTARLGAQANLSAQGLGFPQGQLSTRAFATGGAIAETDPLSLVNPAALAFTPATTLFFQIEPEYRKVVVGPVTDNTTTARYPLFAAILPLGSTWAVGITSSTLLDRTWTTSVDSNVVFGTDTVSSTFLFGSSGSINDLRLAAAWTPNTYIRLGLGGHLISGSDREFVARQFVNNAAFGSFADSTTLSFDGGAVSGGLEVVAPKLLVASASYRWGGNLNARRNDTTLGRGRVPDRLGLSVAYIGIEGTEIAARTSFNKWSSLNGLNQGTTPPAVDAWDSSVGAEIAGPKMGSQPLMLRLGGRWRTLPYEAGPTFQKVKEQTFNAGFGLTMASGRVITDVGLAHAHRDAGIGIIERAWTLSIGLGIRP